VGGLKRGIVASASYEARKLGIYTPMPTSQALRVCPSLIVLPGDFEKYELFSRLMFSYVYDFSPEVEITSIDEGYCDLKGNRRVQPDEAAEKIQHAILQTLKIGVSEGIASNKLVSQIASKLHKPRGLAVVESGWERPFLEPLEVKWLPGVGPKMDAALRAAGLTHIGQLAVMSPAMLRLVAGNSAEQLHQFSLGEDPRPVVTSREAAKSYSQQETFATDTCDEAFLLATLYRMVDHLVEKLQGDNHSARTVSVKIRYSDMDEVERSLSLPEPADLAEDFYPLVRQLLKKAWDRRVRLRLVRVRLSQLYRGSPLPDLFSAPQRQRHQAVQDALSGLRKRFGARALMRSHDWILAKTKIKTKHP
jgi:DNA polymerase-4